MKFQLDDEIELRSYVEKDAEQLFAAVKENYEHLRPFLHWVTPDYSLESAREFIEQNQEVVAKKARESRGIFYRGNLIGAVGFVNFSWDSRRTEIGYWIAGDFEGRGIITKSCKTLINYAFNDLNVNRIEIRCATENGRSRAVPERLGFKLEGILRQFQWRHTRLYDVAVYGLLKAEWQDRKDI